MPIISARRATGALCRTAALVALALAFAFAPGVAHAFASARRTPVTPASGSHGAPTLIGTVVDSSTGRGLPNAQIIVTEVGRVTTTDAGGAFAIAGLPAGTYHVNVLLIGFATAHVTVTLTESATPVALRVAMRPSVVRLTTVQVTATPTGTDPLNITQSTIELSGKELARNLGASVAQTLSNEPGVSTRYNGPAANVPVIRGLTGERILVLQDGERAGDLSSSSADHGLSIDPLNAQRLEVVRGPASLLYGNNALGGVVNVISNDIPTAIPTHLEGYVAAQGESVNPGGAASAGITLPLGGPLALTARLSGRRIDDVRMGGDGQRTLRNSDARNAAGVIGLGFIGDRVTAGIGYRGFDFAYGLPAAPDDVEAGIRLDGRRHQVSGRAAVDLAGGKIGYVRTEATAQWYEHDEIEPTGDVGSQFALRTQTVGATARTQLGRANGAIGLQGLFRQYEVSGAEALTPNASTSSGGLFVFEELPFGAPGGAEERRPRIQAGARFDSYRIGSRESERFGPALSRSFDNVSGSLGLNLPIGTTASLNGSIARAFRAPTVEELFSNGVHAATGTYEIGDASLRAETNAGTDVVLRVQQGRLSSQLSAYYNRVNDYITPVVVGDTVTDEGEAAPLARYRQANASLRGIDGQVEMEVLPRIVIGAMGDIVRGRFREGDFAGEPLPFMPASRLGALARWDNRALSLSADVRHGFAQNRTSQQGCAAAGSGETSGDEPSTGAPCIDLGTPAYTLLDLSAGYQVIVGGRLHSFTLRADNLFDERYFDASSRIKRFAANPGRNLSLVYRVLF